MKKALLILLGTLLLVSCGTKVESDIYTKVNLQLSLPDGLTVASMKVSYGPAGNYFQNLNTRMNYKYPEFTQGEGTITVQKGVYVLAFDAMATLSDGSVRKVRSYEYSAPKDAVNLLKTQENLTINLIYLQ